MSDIIGSKIDPYIDAATELLSLAASDLYSSILLLILPE
jgi:hypothetical protein